MSIHNDLENLAGLLSQHSAALSVFFCAHESGNLPDVDYGEYITMLSLQAEHIENRLSDLMSKAQQAQ